MTGVMLGMALLMQAQAAAPDPLVPPDIVTALEDAVSDAIERARPSVVAILRARNPDGDETLAVRGSQRDNAPMPGRMLTALADLSDPDYLPLPGDFGAGVVVGPECEILTAFHVVRGSARIHVRASDRQSFEAEVIAADPRSDLALIGPVRNPAASLPNLPALELGNAEDLRQGSFLVALGNPYQVGRDGHASATWGILANTARRMVPPPMELDAEIRQAFRHQPTLLQLDSKLNLGMSGGAVINLRGQLIGITTTGGNAEGFDAQAGYAIPMDELGRRVVDSLRKGNEVEYGFLGIRLGNLTPNVVGEVEFGTPAFRGDLVEGDMITAVNDHPVDPEAGVSLALSLAPVGEPVRLRVVRGTAELEKTVFLSKFPTAGEVIATGRQDDWRGLRVDFTSVLAGTTMNDEILKSMAQGSIAIVEIEPGSPAANAGMRRGQVITGVAGDPVRSPSEFREAVAGTEGPVRLDTPDGPVMVKP